MKFIKIIFFFLILSIFSSLTIHPPKVYAIQWNYPGSSNLRGFSHRSIQSTYVGAEVGFTIYIPPDYETSGKRYPVIYFLHGIQGNEWNYFGWMQTNGILNNSNLISIAEKGLTDPYIAVFPNGGAGSGYVDYVENMIIKELIPFVDQNWRTIASRNGRAIEGFSMGGVGSSRFAWKHPDMFASAAPMAGGTDEFLSQNSQLIKDSKLAIRYVTGDQDSYGQQGYDKIIPFLKQQNIPYEEQIIPGVGHNLYEYEQAAALNTVNFHFKAFGSAGSITPPATISPSLPPPSSSISPTNPPQPSSILKPGDANADDKVDGLDYVIWLNHYNQSATGAANGDFDNNGKVDGLDYVI